MAKKRCKSCAEEVEKAAKVCIHCWNKANWEPITIKQIVGLIMVIFFCWWMIQIGQMEQRSLGEPNPYTQE